MKRLEARGTRSRARGPSPSLRLGGALMLAILALGGCKKKATFEKCLTSCDATGKKEHARCLLENPEELCDVAQASGRESCQRVCALAFHRPVPDASASVASAAPGTDLPGTEAGARDLLAQFVAPGADHEALSKSLRPTAADYRALYDADAAAKLEAALTPEWDSGRIVVAPKAGQREVKLWSATTDQLRARTGDAKDHFPGGYAGVAAHINDGVVLYSFKFVEPGNDLGTAYDGLAHVGGHWIIVPKPWRALRDLAPADDHAETDDAVGSSGAKTTAATPPTSKAATGKRTNMRNGAVAANGSLPKEVIQRVVRQRSAAFRRCYEQGLSKNPALKGRVATKFVIGNSGRVTSVADGGSTIGSSAVTSCVAREFASLVFPAPSGGVVAVVYPLDFEPGH